MANNAKFEVEIFGNTSQFENSLKGINSAMSSLKSEASSLRSALRLDPTNTTLMTKLQSNLATQLEQTKNKTTQLKTELAGIDKSTPDGQAKFLKLSKAIQDSETRAGYLQRDIQNLDNSISKGSFNLKLNTAEAENSVEKIKSGFSSLKTVAIGALLEIGSKIASTVQGKFGDWVGGAVDTQKAMISLKNTMNFSGNVGEYDALSSRMKKLAIDTNANSSDALKLATTFIGLGADANTAGKKVDNLVRANQAFGGTSEDLKGVSLAYSQIQASGKLSAENINQITDNNTALGASLKKTVMEMNPQLAQFGSFAEASSKGKVSVEMLDAALEKLGQAGAGGTETMKDSFDSLDETISNALLPALDAITPIITGIVNGVADSIPKVVQWFKDLWDTIAASGAVQTFKDAFKEIGSVLKPVIDSLGFFVGGNSTTVSGSVQLIAGAFKLLADATKGVTSIIKQVADLLKGTGTASDIARSAVAGLLAGFIAFKVVTGIIKATTVAMAIFNAIMALNPFVLIATAIATVVAGLIYFFSQTKTGQALWKSFIDWLLNAWESVKNFFSGLGTWFSELWTGIVNTFKGIWDGVTGFFSGIVEGIKGFFSGLGTWFSELWTGITTTIQNVWNTIVTTVQTVVTSIMTFFQPLTDFIGAIFGLVGAIIELAWQLILAGARGLWLGISSIFGAVVGFFTPIFSAVGSVVSSVFSAIGSFAQGAWNVIVSVFSAVVGFFGGIFNAVSSVVGAVFSAIGSFARAGWNVIVSVFSAVGSWFSGIFSGVTSTVSNVFSGFGNFASSAWNAITSVFSGIGSFFGGIFGEVKRIVDNVLGGITRAIDGVKNTISGITDKVKGLFGGSSIIAQREFVDLKAKGLTQNSSAVENKYNNTFTINGGNSDPTAIARAVVREIELGRA